MARSWRNLAAVALLGSVLAAAGSGVARAAEKEVVIAGYGGTHERLYREKLMPAFEKATGIKVTLVIGTALSNFAKVQATKSRPEIDIYWANELTHAAGKQQGLYAKLDPAVVTNLKDTFELARDPDGIGVLSGVTSTVIMYNKKAMAEAGAPIPTSWADLANPKYKGKIAFYNFSVAYSQDVIVLMARINGGDEDNVKPGIAALKKLREIGNLTSFVASPAELDNMLLNGTAWLTVNGSTRAIIQQEAGAPIDFVNPKEGAGFFANYFDVVKGAPHPEAAQILVNYMIGKEAQEIIGPGLGYAPINRTAVISKELAEKLPFGDEKIKAMIRIDRSKMNQYLDQWAELFNREVMGGR